MAAKRLCLALLLLPCLATAQEKSDLQKILDRLDRLERENRSLAGEVHALREELAASHVLPPAAAAPAPSLPREAQATPQSPPAAALDERVTVAEHRIAEQAQTKVESEHKFPVTLTGMVLFNTYLNGKSANGAEDPTTASLSNNTATAGAGLQQSVVGLKFQGPRIWGGGQIDGSIYVDLFAGGTSSLSHQVRLRIADLSVNWKNTSLMVGQDKPLISPREPTSLAQVGVSPLTAAGNLWLWEPQARVEQRFSFSPNSGLRAQLGVYETSEPANVSVTPEYAGSLAPARPALEGRFELWRQFSDTSRLEIAPGFHISRTHVAGLSVPSNLFTVDWLWQPVSAFQLTGMFFHGGNAAGVGGLRQGFTLLGEGQATAVGATGGWAQFSYFATKRLSFNFYGGEEDDRGADLLKNEIHRNLSYAGNAMYRLGSNVLLGLEAAQVRTSYVQSLYRLTNHYDLAVAYLF